MPPASRNQGTPPTGETPTEIAAASLGCPSAILARNRHRSSRLATVDPNLACVSSLVNFSPARRSCTWGGRHLHRARAPRHLPRPRSPLSDHQAAPPFGSFPLMLPEVLLDLQITRRILPPGGHPRSA
jgi:hypothetical protein